MHGLRYFLLPLSILNSWWPEISFSTWPPPLIISNVTCSAPQPCNWSRMRSAPESQPRSRDPVMNSTRMSSCLHSLRAVALPPEPGIRESDAKAPGISATFLETLLLFALQPMAWKPSTTISFCASLAVMPSSMSCSWALVPP